MKHSLKSMLSLALALVMIFSIFLVPSVSAEEGIPDTEVVTEPVEETNTTEPIETVEPAAETVDENNAVESTDEMEAEDPSENETEEILSDVNVESEISMAAAAPLPEITAQPEDQLVSAGDTVTFTVVAENADSYQWQVDRNDGKGFVNLSNSTTWKNTKTAALSFKAKEGHLAYKFRCVVKNAAGEVITNEVGISMQTLPTIITQPVDQLVSSGDTVTFTVVADNADSYRWQVDRNDGKGFVNLSNSTTWKNTKTATLSFKAADVHQAYKFRCVVKNASGEVISDVVGISMQTLPTITAQPEDQVVSVGDTVKFTVVADDAESYQWQIDRNNGKGFVNLSNSTTWKNTKTATLSFKAADVHQAYKFRCVVKNAAGEVISDEVGISMQTLPTITAQPVDQVVSVGDTVTFSVVADNADSYQWQVDRNVGKGFVNLSNSTTWKNTKTAALSFKAADVHQAYKFRCVVKNAAGEVISDEVGISMQTLPTITTQPVDQVVSSGDTVKFTVVADDAESYQWQVDRNDGKGFVNLSNSTTWKNTKTATLSFKAKEVHLAYKFRCVVKNAAGEVISDEVGISFEESQWVIDGVVYGKLTETTVILLNYTGTAETLTIPELVEGKTVVEIAVEAFMDNTNLVSIDLPDTITVIRARAFKGCVNLREMK